MAITVYVGSMEIVKLCDAIKLGLSQYFTRKPCKHGHIAPRYVNRRQCVICSKAKSARWQTDNAEHINQYNRERRSNNRESYQETDRRYYNKNSAARIQAVQNWRRDNPVRSRATTAKSRAGEAAPVWLTEADEDAILEFYWEAHRLTEGTGVQHDVDHVIPLSGSYVSGLHVPWNLQVLTHGLNCEKGARYGDGN